jgi:hypothetical protein
MIDLTGVEVAQVEADVVVIFVNEDGYGMVAPFWECSMDEEELLSMAFKMGLNLVEKNSGQTATFKIFDFRK